MSDSSPCDVEQLFEVYKTCLSIEEGRYGQGCKVQMSMSQVRMCNINGKVFPQGIDM